MCVLRGEGYVSNPWIWAVLWLLWLKWHQANFHFLSFNVLSLLMSFFDVWSDTRPISIFFLLMSWCLLMTTQEVDIAAWPSRPGQWLGCIGSQVSYACSWIFIRLLWQFDFSFCPVLVSLPAFAGTDLQSIAYTANSLTMSASQKPNMSQCDKWTAVLVPMRSCYC